jgi:LacI family transcriptional regulator
MVTLRDIAKKVGYSKSFVSRALNNHPRVNVSTREFILAVSREMGYYPNRAARSLVSYKTETIGIIISSISDPYCSPIIDGIQFANQADYTLIFSNSYQALQEKYFGRIDGLIVFESRFHEREQIREMIGQEIPLVLIESYISDHLANCVWVDNVHGGYIATKHLIELGHTRIAHIAGNLKYTFLLDRLEGYKKALSESSIQLQPELILTGNDSSEDGYWAMKNLFTNFCVDTDGPNFTAVFAANDQIAFGVLKAIHEAGLSVPGDISVVSYDDVQYSGYTNPPLTTVREPRFKIGEKAMAMLSLILHTVTMNHGTRDKGNKTCLLPELVIRNTTSQLPNPCNSLVTVCNQ